MSRTYIVATLSLVIISRFPLLACLMATSGTRLARWIRESTAGQYDRFGPASQREQQDRFIERHGLVDTGLCEHPGRVAGSTG